MKSISSNDLKVERIMKMIAPIVEQALSGYTARYTGGYDDHGDVPEDKEDEYIDSVDYVIDSIINGNLSYARSRIAKMEYYDVDELLELAEERGVLDKVRRLIRSVD